jgi:hypothetical protein
MKSKLMQSLRWIAILACLGLSAWIVIPSGMHMARRFDGDWLGIIFLILFLLCISAFPLAIAYFIYRHQYHSVCSVICGIASVVIFGLLLSLPSRFELYREMNQWFDHYPFLAIVALPVALAFLFGPYYLATWFYHFSLRLLDRYFHDAEPHNRNA